MQPAKTFKEFVDAVGGEEAAAIVFGESARAVRSWYYGERIPRPATAKRLVAIAKQHPKGPLSLDSIYGTAA